MVTRLPKIFEQVQEPGDGLTDAQLLARFVAARDESSFAALLLRHGPMVLGVCRRVVRDAHDAEDAFQATFLILARKAAAVVKRDSVGSYLHAIAYHTAVGAARANARRRRERSLRDMPHLEAPPADPAAAETDWRPLLDRELNRLSERCRAALVLCDLEGMPQRRAAAHLGISLSTLSSRLLRARTLLAKRLTARGLTLSTGAVVVVLAAESAWARVPALLEVSTVRVAVLAATGQMAAVPTPAAVLMNGVMKAMFMRKLRLVVSTVIMAGALLGAIGLACRPANEAVAQDKPAVADKDTDQVPNVQVSKPVIREVADHQEFTANAEARETVDLRCRVGGYLTKVACNEGSLVKKGDLLFEVDPRPWQAEVDKAAAEVVRAAASRRKTQADVDRIKKLSDAKTTSQEEYLSALATNEVAEASLKVAQAGLDKAKLDLESTRVTAPIDGTIVKAPLSVGNFVNAGATTLAKIASTDPMAVAFDIDERTFLVLQDAARAGMIKSIHGGKYPIKMRLANANDEEFKYDGLIDSVDQQVDPKNGTVRVRAIFPNHDGRLIPGLFARIQLVTGPPRKTLLVDPEAVWSDKEGTAVFIVNDKNVVERRSVKLGRTIDGLQAVKTGLEAGNLVVVWELAPKGQVVPARGTVKAGMNVRPELVVMPRQAEKKPQESTRLPLDLSEREKRMLRWVLRFETNDPDDYISQLAGLGAIVAIPTAKEGEYKVIRDLKQRPAQPQAEDVAKLNRIYWVDDKEKSVGGVMKKLGLPEVSHFIAFMPEALEKKLFDKELKFKGLKEEQIHETKFKVVKSGDGYDVEVTSQTPK